MEEGEEDKSREKGSKKRKGRREGVGGPAARSGSCGRQAVEPGAGAGVLEGLEKGARKGGRAEKGKAKQRKKEK